MLPTTSFGELSDSCDKCRPVAAPATKQGLLDELPRLAVSSFTWPLATGVLIAISVAVFAAMVATGISPIAPTSVQLMGWGANYGPATLGGQYWRLITSSFLHIGFFHLALNMVSLWFLGRMVEKFFGAFITCGLYLLTAVGAGLLTLAWNPIRISAGASGAIFGLDGVLISVLYFGKLGIDPDLVRRALSWVVKIALVNLLYGLTGNIDNMAHLGGLVTGLVAGVFLAHSFSSPSEDRISQQTRVLAATTFVLLLLLFPVKQAKGWAIEFGQGQTAFDHRDYKTAIIHFEKYVAHTPDNPNVHAVLGYAYHSDNRVDDAVREYQRALALKPDMPWVQLTLANIYAYQKKSQEAVTLYQKCMGRTKPRAVDYRFYAAALYDLRDYTTAETELQQSLALDAKDPAAHDLLADIYDKLGKTREAKKERQLATDLNKNGR